MTFPLRMMQLCLLRIVFRNFLMVHPCFPFIFPCPAPLLNSHLAALGWLCVSEASELRRPLSSVLCKPQSSVFFWAHPSRTRREVRPTLWAKTRYNTLSCQEPPPTNQQVILGPTTQLQRERKPREEEFLTVQKTDILLIKRNLKAAVSTIVILMLWGYRSGCRPKQLGSLDWDSNIQHLARRNLNEHQSKSWH